MVPESVSVSICYFGRFWKSHIPSEKTYNKKITKSSHQNTAVKFEKQRNHLIVLSRCSKYEILAWDAVLLDHGLPLGIG